MTVQAAKSYRAREVMCNLLQGPEPVGDLLPADLPIAPELHLDAGNGGHLQLPHVFLKVVTASSKQSISRSCPVHLMQLFNVCSQKLMLQR